MKPLSPSGRLPLLGHLLSFRRDPLAFVQKCRIEHHEIVQIQMYGRDIFLIFKPEFIQEVLVTQAKNFKKSRALQLARDLLGDGLLTAEGDFHLRQRRMIAPAFHRKKIMGYGNIMALEAAKFKRRLKPGTKVDLHQ
jgi:cytochrome P450